VQRVCAVFDCGPYRGHDFPHGFFAPPDGKNLCVAGWETIYVKGYQRAVGQFIHHQMFRYAAPTKAGLDDRFLRFKIRDRPALTT